MTSTINLTSGQLQALQLAETIGDNSFGNNRAIMIQGYAGTGKTYLIPQLVEKAKAQGKGQVFISAPTNKAVLNVRRVLDNSAWKYMTLHALIYGVPDRDGNWIPKSDIIENAILVVDEASMITLEVAKDLEEKCKNCFFIFLGDPFQLEPVGNPSDIFNLPKVILTEVVRYGDGILDTATALRNIPEDMMRLPVVVNESVQLKNMTELIRDWATSLSSGKDVVLLAATNKFRVNANHILRKAFGKTAPLTRNETLIAVNNSLYANGETFTVESFEYAYSTDVEIKAKNPDDSSQTLTLYAYNAVAPEGKFRLVLIPDLMSASFHAYPLFNMLAIAELRMLFGSENVDFKLRKVQNVVFATYGYCISAHKAQGSQWDEVYINFDYSGKSWDKRRWMYTAVTRAKKKVFIVPQNHLLIS